MQIDPSPVLALIADLYSQVGTLVAENAQLRAELSKQPEPS